MERQRNLYIEHNNRKNIAVLSVWALCHRSTLFC